MKSYRLHPAGEEHSFLQWVSEEGTDIGAYLEAAKLFEYEYLYFLNTYSEILCDGWLEKMQFHLAMDGLVGATGSYETMHLPGWHRFPNHHIRSNAFGIKRDVLLDLKFSIPKDKFDCYQFESGPMSLTNRMKKLYPSWIPLIIGKDGIGYGEDEWEISSTYRIRNQENLLIADNQTRAYQNAEPKERERLSRLAWGG